MSSIKENVIRECERSEPRNYSQIHLYAEGSFVRAYNWSAWLLCRFVRELKTTKRKFKDIDQPVVFVGFPKTSIEKFKPTDSVLEQIDDKHSIVTLPMDITESLLQEMEAEFAKWKEDVPLTESAREKKLELNKDGESAEITLTSIMQQVLSFPLESKSPIDCMLFIADIKRQISKLV